MKFSKIKVFIGQRPTPAELAIEPLKVGSQVIAKGFWGPFLNRFSKWNGKVGQIVSFRVPDDRDFEREIVLMQTGERDEATGMPLCDSFCKNYIAVDFGDSLGIKAVPRVNLMLKPKEKHKRSRSGGATFSAASSWRVPINEYVPPRLGSARRNSVFFAQEKNEINFFKTKNYNTFLEINFAILFFRIIFNFF